VEQGKANAVRYVSFRRPDGASRYGRLEGEQVADIGSSLREALTAGRLDEGAAGENYALNDVGLLPPIPDPGKIICIGLNYATHLSEMGNKRPDYPTVFTRFTNTLAAHGAPLVRPSNSTRFDYEGELAVIIGRPARHVRREQAMDHVAGFSVFNDASVRDWQRHTSQFTPGKNFPSTGGFGPALVTPDEIADIASMRVQTRLNGEVLQDQPISDMLWPVAELIAYLSEFTELAPGDVIVTGTPGGVGDARTPPVYMQSGDVVEVSIGSVGTLRNPVIAEG
jgi:2-keto-4-pentenoate hydratase/2-oxohepta-3-ene-1,7-dioic acid hydratase in catechol pathway